MTYLYFKFILCLYIFSVIYVWQHTVWHDWLVKYCFMNWITTQDEHEPHGLALSVSSPISFLSQFFFFFFFRRAGSREDGIRHPVWRRCFTTAPFSSSCSAPGHPGVWLLVETPCSIHRQGEPSTSVFVLCVHYDMIFYLFLFVWHLSEQLSVTLRVRPIPQSQTHLLHSANLCPLHLSLSLSLWFTNLCSLNSDEKWVSEDIFKVCHQYKGGMSRLISLFLLYTEHIWV